MKRITRIMHDRCQAARANTLWEGGDLGLGACVAVGALPNTSATTTTEVPSPRSSPSQSVFARTARQRSCIIRVFLFTFFCVFLAASRRASFFFCFSKVPLHWAHPSQFSVSAAREGRVLPLCGPVWPCFKNCFKLRAPFGPFRKFEKCFWPNLGQFRICLRIRLFPANLNFAP